MREANENFKSERHRCQVSQSGVDITREERDGSTRIDKGSSGIGAVFLTAVGRFSR